MLLQIPVHQTIESNFIKKSFKYCIRKKLPHITTLVLTDYDIYLVKKIKSIFIISHRPRVFTYNIITWGFPIEPRSQAAKYIYIYIKKKLPTITIMRYRKKQCTVFNLRQLNIVNLLFKKKKQP